MALAAPLRFGRKLPSPVSRGLCRDAGRAPVIGNGILAGIMVFEAAY